MTGLDRCASRNICTAVGLENTDPSSTGRCVSAQSIVVYQWCCSLTTKTTHFDEANFYKPDISVKSDKFLLFFTVWRTTYF